MIVELVALVTALATVALAVSVYALLSAHKLFHAAKIITEAVRAECTGVVETAQAQCNAIAMELQSVKLQTPEGFSPGIPKPGMNLTRRSNALRLHRIGTSPEQIASAIEVPRQEVDLLLKVHEIVLNKL